MSGRKLNVVLLQICLSEIVPVCKLIMSTLRIFFIVAVNIFPNKPIAQNKNTRNGQL